MHEELNASILNTKPETTNTGYACRPNSGISCIADAAADEERDYYYLTTRQIWGGTVRNGLHWIDRAINDSIVCIHHLNTSQV